MLDLTRLWKCLVLLVFGVIVQITSSKISLDERSRHICKEYKVMCSTGKICASQHFHWPHNMTFPVCVSLIDVPVRNPICSYPPYPGHCQARYIRWHFNKHSGRCSWFTYGGCGGNENNFRSRDICEKKCAASPEIIKLISESMANDEEDKSKDVVSPAIITAPVFEPPEVRSGSQALSSYMDIAKGSNNDFDDRYPIKKPKKERSRKRRRLQKEKRRRQLRRERKREKRRLRKLKEKRDKRGKKDKSKKKRKGKKDRKRKKNDITNETVIETNSIEEKPNESERQVSGTAELRAKPETTFYKMFSILDKNGQERHRHHKQETMTDILHTSS